MVMKIEIGNLWPNMQVQRIEVRLLMTALTIGTTQLDNTNLFAFMLGDAHVGPDRQRLCSDFCKLGKVVTNG